MSDSPACSGTNLFPPKWRFHRDRGKESYPFILRIFWHRELVQKIATMVENIEKLKKEKALLLKQFLCSSLKRAYRVLVRQALWYLCVMGNENTPVTAQQIVGST